MTLRTAAATDVGCQRETNEDAVLCTQFADGHLLAVADGMGGHRAGDVASEAALDAFRRHLSTADPARQDLRDAVSGANDHVRELASEEPSHEGMGTTLVAAVVTGDRLVVVNVGDSRAYLVGDRPQQITTDQTLVRELVEQGTIDEAEAASHPQRHVLSQALGTNETVDPDVFERDVDGRTILLCSDGLTEEVDDRTIGQVVRAGTDPTAIADRLVQQANENGGSDNVSVVVGQPAADPT